MARLPVSSDTRRVVGRRRELEEGLASLELQQRQYSRQKVFVPSHTLEC